MNKLGKELEKIVITIKKRNNKGQFMKGAASFTADVLLQRLIVHKELEKPSKVAKLFKTKAYKNYVLQQEYQLGYSDALLSLVTILQSVKEQSRLMKK